MSRHIQVRVLDSAQNPIEEKRVRIHVALGGLLGMKGGWLDAETTDEDGYAHFETTEDYPDSQELTIHVGGEEFAYEFGDRAEFTVTLGT